MGLQELALEIYIVMLCLNAGVLIVDALVDTPLVTPFDQSTVTGITSGPVTSIFNSTTYGGDQTLVGNLSSGTQQNSTIGGSGGSLNPIETVFFPLALLWSFIQFVTGGFIFQVMGLFGFPDIFIFSLQAIIGVLLARMIIYYVWGR